MAEGGCPGGNRGIMSKTSSSRLSSKRTAHRRGRHRRGRSPLHQEVSVQNGLLLRTQTDGQSSTERDFALVAPTRRGHRHGYHARPANRPYVTAGVALLGASALVGSLVSATPDKVESAEVQLAATAGRAPMPNELLAALVERRGVGAANPGVSPLGSALAESGSSIRQAARAVGVEVERIAAAVSAGIIDPATGDLSDADLDSAALALAAAIGGLASGAEIAFVLWDTFH